MADSAPRRHGVALALWLVHAAAALLCPVFCLALARLMDYPGLLEPGPEQRRWFLISAIGSLALIVPAQVFLPPWQRRVMSGPSWLVGLGAIYLSHLSLILLPALAGLILFLIWGDVGDSLLLTLLSLIALIPALPRRRDFHCDFGKPEP